MTTPSQDTRIPVRSRHHARRGSAILALPQRFQSGLSVDQRGLGVSALQSVIDRMGPQEIRRRLWHIAPGFLPCLLWVIPHERPLSSLMKGLILLDVVVLLFMAIFQNKTFKRSNEASAMPCILGYAAPIIALLLLLPGQPELGLAVLAIVAFGDGMATVVGMLFSGRPLPWNHDKTWAGSFAFVLCAAPIATLFYWGEAHPQVSFAAACLCAIPAAVVAAAAESVASRHNDNLRVSLSATLAILAAQSLFVGWSS